MNSRRVQRRFSESAFVRVLWLVALALAFLPLAANARSLFVPRRVVVTILKDSLAVGDSIAATAITYGPQGTPTADGTMAWSTAPVGCAAVRVPTGTSARAVVATGTLAGKCVVTGTWREYGATGRDSLKVYTKTPPTPVVTTVTVGLSASTLTIGQTSQAAAIIRDQNNAVMTGQVVGWSTSAPTVAAVSGSGVVTAVGAGSTAVSATVSGVVGSGNVTVMPIQPDTVQPPPSPTPIGTVAYLIAISGGCLRAGSVVTVTASCSPTDTAQRFIVPAVNVLGPIGGTVGSSMRCLVDSAAQIAILVTCDGSTRQQWKRAGYTSTLAHLTSGKCLAAASGKAVLYPCGLDAFMAWTTEPISSGGGGGGGGGSPTPPPASTCTSVDSAVATKPHPNEPTGLTPLHTHAGLQVMPCGWSNGIGQISIVDDPEKGKALQLAMSPTTTPGSGTARIDTDPEVSTYGATRIYIALWEKLSPTFKGNNGAGGLKNVIVHSQQSYAGGSAFHLPGLVSDPSNIDGRIRPVASMPVMTAHDGITVLPPNNVLYWPPDAGQPGDPGDLFARNQWHFVEAVYDFASKGQANGSFKLWIDGRLVVPTVFLDLYINGLVGTRLQPTYDGMLRFTGLEITNVWGGGGVAIPADNWYRFKDVYVSGGYARAGEQPTRWALTAQEGTSVPAGSQIHVTAQLVDANSNPVDICGLSTTVTLTNGGTWAYWDGAPIYAPYTVCEHGRQLYLLTVPSGGTTLTVTDYATVWNGQRGQPRAGTLTITTR